MRICITPFGDAMGRPGPDLGVIEPDQSVVRQISSAIHAQEGYAVGWN